MNIKVRALQMIAVGRKIEDVIVKHVCTDTDGMTPSCLSCVHFDEHGAQGFGSEVCLPYRQRPPARIIALGCHEYKDKDDIPF